MFQTHLYAITRKFNIECLADKTLKWLTNAVDANVNETGLMDAFIGNKINTIHASIEAATSINWARIENVVITAVATKFVKTMVPIFFCTCINL